MVQARPTIEQKNIKCPICSETEIKITIISEYMSVHSTFSAGGRKKMMPNYHQEKIQIHSNCPNCKAKKTDIKQALDRGTSKFKTHEERIQSFKDRGLPLILESKKQE